MSKVKTLLSLLKTNPKHVKVALLSNFAHLKISRLVPDKLYLKMCYKAYIGKKLNLKNPISFNEKLQWIKLYDRRPEYIEYVDKFDVKKYISEKLGDEYIIPTLGVWENVEDIDFDSLPEQFVLKGTHDSGSVVICKDKSSFNVEKAKEKLRKSLRANMYWHGREWPYKELKPRIICEKYIEDSSGELRDYKLMCFNGEVKCSFVCSERFSGKGLHVTFFDRDWNLMKFERSFPHVKEGLPKPNNYGKMVELAEKLSKDIPFVRVDFYEVEGNIYFGELTFFPGCGFEAFQPEEWDYKLGEWITLPEKRKL